MTMPGMLDMNQPVKPRRRGARSRRITRVFAVGIVATMLGGGVAIVQNMEAEAATQAQINRFIRANGGLPPCKWEDGSGQAGPCVWIASKSGDGNGDSLVAMPDGADKDDDKELIYITGPLAVRR